MQQFELKFVNALHDDHMATLAVLERVEAVLTKQGKKSCPSEIDANMTALLNDMTAILSAEVTGHFAFEEEYLFPRFAEMADHGIPMMLKSEHDIIRPLAAELRGLCQTAKSEGFTQETWEMFYDKGLEMVEREVFHIQKEEMGFLPAIDQMIDEEDQAELEMAYAEKKASI